MNDQKPTVEQRLDEILSELEKAKRESEVNFWITIGWNVAALILLGAFMILILSMHRQ